MKIARGAGTNFEFYFSQPRYRQGKHTDKRPEEHPHSESACRSDYVSHAQEGFFDGFVSLIGVFDAASDAFEDETDDELDRADTESQSTEREEKRSAKVEDEPARSDMSDRGTRSSRKTDNEDDTAAAREDAAVHTDDMLALAVNDNGYPNEEHDNETE